MSTSRTVSRRDVLMGAGGVVVASALPDIALPAITKEPLRTTNGFLVSATPSCGRHGNLGDWGPSVVGYQQDHECFGGIWMDADTYFEGYAKDEVFHPCQCHPKHCKTCNGTGWKMVKLGTMPEDMDEDDDPDNGIRIECTECRAGWVGEWEHPDDRYCEGYEPPSEEDGSPPELIGTSLMEGRE